MSLLPRDSMLNASSKPFASSQKEIKTSWGRNELSFQILASCPRISLNFKGTLGILIKMIFGKFAK